MMSINEVSRKTHLSIRALHYYDEIGLLKPSKEENGYRMYSEKDLEVLQQILIFRELEFPLSDIKKILESPGYDREKALMEQIKLLKLKKEHIEDLISHAEKVIETGGYKMEFDVFDKEKLKKNANEAKEKWGNTDAYKECAEKTASYSDDKMKDLAAEMMDIFKEFGAMTQKDPKDKEVQNEVKKLQDFITDNYYNCTSEILNGLGMMYVSGGEMTDNIDNAGGSGTAEFVSKAIKEYCK